MTKAITLLAIGILGVLLIAGALVGHTAEAKSKKKYSVTFFLDVDAPFKDKKTPIKIGIENIHNEIVASKKVDVRDEIDDQDEEEIILGNLKVKDKNENHVDQVAGCIIVNHANDGEQCDGDFKKEGKNRYSVRFSYTELLQLVFG